MRRLLTALGLLAALLGGVASAGASPVRVILWFDTEDYLSPNDDDACLRLANLLTERGLRATFKVVGEKARVLEQRGRRDVIAALGRHAIGYHANFHSVHPTPSEYLAECGWLDGVAEFNRREGPGAADVRRIFRVSELACYGQPGSSWAPQAIGALAGMAVAPHGVPCYLDDGSQVGLENRPFWYAGALNVFNLGVNQTRMDLHDPAALEPAKARVGGIVRRLAAEADGGLISIYYHPCEWIHREFWDGVNFRRGANPPREQWRPPPQLTPAETDAAFRQFAQYLDHLRSLPEIRFVTAADLPLIYPDLIRTEGATREELIRMTRRILADRASGLDFMVGTKRAFSLADQFDALSSVVAAWTTGAELKLPLPIRGLLGPDSPPPTNSTPKAIDGYALRDSVGDVRNYLATQGRIPARVMIGAIAVPPADYLVALAAAADEQQPGRAFAPADNFPMGRQTVVLPARRIAEDSAKVFGGWIIHPEGFRAPRILEQARLQAWTLKPAQLAPSANH